MDPNRCVQHGTSDGSVPWNGTFQTNPLDRLFVDAVYGPSLTTELIPGRSPQCIRRSLDVTSSALRPVPR